MSKKKQREIFRDIEGEGRGRLVSPAQNKIDPKGTMRETVKRLHPFTQAFENVRKGEKAKAQKIIKRFSEEEAKAFIEILNTLTVQVVARGIAPVEAEARIIEQED